MEIILSDNYRSERQRRGSQKGVALLLGVDGRTIQRREAGEVPITRETWLALCSLPLRKTEDSRKGTNARVQGTAQETTNNNEGE